MGNLIIDDNKLKEYYFDLWYQKKGYNSYCESIAYLNFEMETILKTLDLLDIKVDWFDK